jgi:hypothetical protein
MGKTDVTSFRILGKRSISQVAHAHPVPCVEGVSWGDTSTRVRGALEGHLGALRLRTSDWPIGILALLGIDY